MKKKKQGVRGSRRNDAETITICIAAAVAAWK